MRKSVIIILVLSLMLFVVFSNAMEVTHNVVSSYEFVIPIEYITPSNMNISKTITFT